jgi:hypothetical protein
MYTGLIANLGPGPKVSRRQFSRQRFNAILNLRNGVGEAAFAKAFPPANNRQADWPVGDIIAKKNESIVGFFSRRWGIPLGGQPEIQDVGTHVVVIPERAIDYAFQCVYRDHSTAPDFIDLVKYAVFTMPFTMSATTASLRPVRAGTP